MGYVQKAVTPIAPIQLLTEIEVSRMTKISVKTLQRWRCIGYGPIFIKLGEGKKAPVRYDPNDIQTYAKQGRRYPSVRATQGE